MMKNMRKIFSILLVMMVVLSLSLTAFAAEGEETYTITITDSVAGRTYEAYQILTGTPQTVDGKKVLINQKWGASAKKSGEISAEDEAALEAGIANNASTYVDFTKPVKSVNTQVENAGLKQYVISGLEPGYYLVRQTAKVEGHDAHTAYILQIVEDVTVETKIAKPTVDKQVQDEVDGAETPTNAWGDTADHAINESFQFKLTATVTADSDYDYYETYKLVFTDTMSAGITFESLESVTVGGTRLTATQYTSNHATAQDTGITTLTVTIANLRAIEGVDLVKDGTTVEVIYKAHLNENALADAPADNGVVLEYSNNPNAGGEGDMGTTPEEYAYVFTYEVKNTKTDGEKALAGAGFRLYTDEACTQEVALIFDEDLKAYRPVGADEEAEEMFSAANTGVFNIVGLDCGTYYLKETTVPEGYNPCDNVKIVISATHEMVGTTPTVTIDTETSQNMENTIVNKAGLTLPSTGGIGTTFMYIIGGILVFFAVVILVTKLKMKVN